MTSHLQLSVDLELESVPIGGSVSSGEQAARRFQGWLELASAIEGLRKEALTSRSPCTGDRLVPPIAAGSKEVE
jgi:hypothetical protein